MFMCQSKSNSDEKVLFGIITPFLNQKIRKMPVKGFCGNREFYFDSGP